MTGKLSLPDLLAKQRQLQKMTVKTRRFILKGPWRGNCLSSGEVVEAAYGISRARCEPPMARYDPQLCIMLYAWMDRWYPRVRSHKVRLYQGSTSHTNNCIVWKVR